MWFTREQRDFLPRACKQTFSLEDIKTKTVSGLGSIASL